MTKRQKTSQAVHKTARLNPINPLERRVLEVILYWEGKGINFKQLVVDRLSRVDLELTPEIFAKDSALHGLSIESVLQQYSEYLLDELRKQGFSTPMQSTPQEDADNGTFSQNLASGFLARKRQARGDDE
jgi:hypothetical protein